MKYLLGLSLGVLLGSGLGTPAVAAIEERTYEIPDVRNVFCGAEIAPKYCKCGFHNQSCKSLGMSSDEANAYVLQEFREWNRANIQAMGERCIDSGHDWDRASWTCTIDTDRTERLECQAALRNLPTEWEKYSDFDSRIPISEASAEVQGYDQTLDEIADLITKITEHEITMEAERQYRLELRAYKQALVQNIKTNLLKAFWRLSYVTYITIDGAKGGGESVKKLLNPTDSAEVIGAGLKLIQANTPGHVKELQVSDGTIKGKVKSIGYNASLEALESIADPSAVVQQVMKDVKGAVVPSADISPEEVEILRSQHIENNDVNDALAESYANSTRLRGQIWTLEAIIAQKYNELQQWKLKEYQRVKKDLTTQCKGLIN